MYNDKLHCIEVSTTCLSKAENMKVLNYESAQSIFVPQEYKRDQFYLSFEPICREKLH